MQANITVLKGGHTTEDPRCDRIPLLDDKSKNFPVSTRLEPTQYRKPRGYTWRLNVSVLDQGQEGACVSCGVGHDLLARPGVVEGVNFQWCHSRIYHPAQHDDPWAGCYLGPRCPVSSSNSIYEGTSVLSGLKMATALGYYSEYRWCFTLDDVIATLGYLGPVIIGFNWYQGMSQTDAKGFIHPTGRLVGGHCVLVNRVNVREEYFEGPNSWGPDWGINGGYWRMTFEEFDRVRLEDGEVAAPTRTAKRLVTA